MIANFVQIFNCGDRLLLVVVVLSYGSRAPANHRLAYPLLRDEDVDGRRLVLRSRFLPSTSRGFVRDEPTSSARCNTVLTLAVNAWSCPAASSMGGMRRCGPSGSDPPKEFSMRLALVVVLACGAGGEVATKFSLRNLSGESIGVWWLQPMPGAQKKMVPQTLVSIRNSSSLEVNSYRGHEFVIRRRGWKESLEEEGYVPQADEAILVIGSTNDMVVVDETLSLARHDAVWAVRRGIRASLASPTATLDDVVATTTKVVEAWREAWLAEEQLRKLMEADMASLGGEAPSPPVEPPGGWPPREPEALTHVVAQVVATCGRRGVPRDPAWFDGEVFDEARLRALLAEWGEEERCKVVGDDIHAAAFAVAVQGDAHELCARWARVGECNTNPRYMLVRCARACALWEAHGHVTLVYDDDFREATRERDGFVECVATGVSDAAVSYRGALNAEQNAKSAFAEGLRNRTCAATAPGQKSRGPHSSTPGFDFVDADGRIVPILPLFQSSKALPAASISLLEQFATQDECTRVMSSARPRLSPATVNSEESPAVRSLARRAHAANVEPDPDNPHDLVSKLWRRAFDAANFLTGYGLDPHGQEPFSVIYYNGSRALDDDDLPDEYRPHCAPVACPSFRTPSLLRRRRLRWFPPPPRRPRRHPPPLLWCASSLESSDLLLAAVPEKGGGALDFILRLTYSSCSHYLYQGEYRCHAQSPRCCLFLLLRERIQPHGLRPY